MSTGFEEAGRFFDSSDFSDINLKYGDREVKCHRIILSSGSEYFRIMLKPDGAFAESKQRIVELKEDPPTAMDDMISWIYGTDKLDDYMSSFLREFKDLESCVQHWIDLYNIAKKYLLHGLECKALSQLRTVLMGRLTSSKVMDVEQIFGVVRLLKKHGDEHEVFSNEMKRLVWTRSGILMDHKEFRLWLETEGEAAREVTVELLKGGR